MRPYQAVMSEGYVVAALMALPLFAIFLFLYLFGLR
jgi:hypothetical protein